MSAGDFFVLEQSPDCHWPEVHKELKRKGVTLALLWQEYKEQHPVGYQYSWFCHQYADWSGTIDLVMRQEHRAGEKLFVDYAGQTVPIVRGGRDCLDSSPVIYKWKAVPFLCRFFLRKCAPVDFIGKPIFEALVTPIHVVEVDIRPNLPSRLNY